MLCVSDLDFRKVYKSSLAVGLSGFLEHTVILCSTELNKGQTLELRLRLHGSGQPLGPAAAVPKQDAITVLQS